MFLLAFAVGHAFLLISYTGNGLAIFYPATIGALKNQTEIVFQFENYSLPLLWGAKPERATRRNGEVMARHCSQETGTTMLLHECQLSAIGDLQAK